MTRTNPVDAALTAACNTREDIGAAIRDRIQTIAKIQFEIKQLSAQAVEMEDLIDQLLDKRLA